LRTIMALRSPVGRGCGEIAERHRSGSILLSGTVPSASAFLDACSLGGEGALSVTRISVQSSTRLSARSGCWSTRRLTARAQRSAFGEKVASGCTVRMAATLVRVAAPLQCVSRRSARAPNETQKRSVRIHTRSDQPKQYGRSQSDAARLGRCGIICAAAARCCLVRRISACIFLYDLRRIGRLPSQQTR